MTNLPTTHHGVDLDEHILAQISATPECIAEFCADEGLVPPGGLSLAERFRIGTLMYEDPDIWAAHATVLKRALYRVRPDLLMERAVDHAWQHITQDIADHVHAPDVASFSALHDNVDANQYLIDAAEEVGMEWGESGEVDPLNTLSDRLDAMLKARLGREVRRPITSTCPGCQQPVQTWEDSHWCVEGGGTPVHDATACRDAVGCTCIHCPVCPGLDVHLRACPHFAEQFPPEDYPEYYRDEEAERAIAAQQPDEVLSPAWMERDPATGEVPDF